MPLCGLRVASNYVQKRCSSVEHTPPTVAQHSHSYGPFWVASTLIFVTAATGNYASYIDWKRHAPAGEEHAAWYYDVDKVGARIAGAGLLIAGEAIASCLKD